MSIHIKRVLNVCDLLFKCQNKVFLNIIMHTHKIAQPWSIGLLQLEQNTHLCGLSICTQLPAECCIPESNHFCCSATFKNSVALLLC